jgi:PAS domain S-box-containing protein
LRESQEPEGIVYLVLYDNYGKVAAASGWDPARPPPSSDGNTGAADTDTPDRHDARTPITLAGQQHGVLHFGVSTRFLREATATLLQQSIAIAAAEVVLSIALLALVGFWLTRHLAMLAQASERIARGEYDRRVPVDSADEVGQLARAFNAMSQAVQSRIEALSDSESRFHAIADYTHDWENWTAPDGRLLWVNPSVERLTGYRPEECLAMADFPLPLVVDEARERVAREFARACEGASGSDFEFRVKRKDGSEFWATVAWQPIYGPNGEYLGHRSSIRDTTARKEAELALKDKLGELQRSEEEQKRLRSRAENEQARMQSLLAAMNVGVLFEDTDNCVIYTNPAFRRIWLIPESINLIGNPTSEVLRHSANVLAQPDHFSRHILHVTETHEVVLPGARCRWPLHREAVDVRGRDPRTPDRRAADLPRRARFPDWTLQPASFPGGTGPGAGQCRPARG